MMRGGRIWLVVVQCIALALSVLACVWAEPPERYTLVLLGGLGVGLLLVALIPLWRRHALSGVLCGVGLAFLCSLATKNAIAVNEFGDTIPMLLPILIAISIPVVLWGIFARVGLRDQAGFGIAALIGGALILLVELLFYYLTTYTGFKMLYSIEVEQLLGVVTAALLYPLAMWLAGVGVRPDTRLAFLPLGIGLLLLGATAYWFITAKGGH